MSIRDGSVVLPDPDCGKNQPDDCCANCVFVMLEEGTESLRCRRMPPQCFIVPTPVTHGNLLDHGGRVSMGLGVRSEFRPVSPEMWCGEHRRAPQASSKGDN